MTSPASNAAQPKSRRRWYQFGLRTLLIVVTLAGCTFAWLGLKFREARRQQAAVAAIEKLGGRVQYDYEFDSRGNPVPNATAPGPKWLHSLLGNDFFGNVEVVDLSNTLVTDADLEQLEALRATRKLFLDGTEITDFGLEHLKGLTQLRVLALDAWQVTEAGVVKVRRASPDCYICGIVENKINVFVRRAPDDCRRNRRPAEILPPLVSIWPADAADRRDARRLRAIMTYWAGVPVENEGPDMYTKCALWHAGIGFTAWLLLSACALRWLHGRAQAIQSGDVIIDECWLGLIVIFCTRLVYNLVVPVRRRSAAWESVWLVLAIIDLIAVPISINLYPPKA